MTRQKLQIKCALCGKKVISKEQNSGVEKIDGTSYTFDSYEGVLMFKKFGRTPESVYSFDVLKYADGFFYSLDKFNFN
jgi:transcription elongation factor Elf1